MDQQHSGSGSFAAIPERNTGDNMLRVAQQHHVSLSSMADLKANILITVSSIVLTMALGRVQDLGSKLPLVVLVACTLIALLLAILAVLPKYRALRVDEGPLPANFNLLFFGHFASLPRERFLDEVSRALKPDGSVYSTMANDLYSLGWYLAHRKYFYLRYSYLFFLAGFVLASLLQLGVLLAG